MRTEDRQKEKTIADPGARETETSRSMAVRAPVARPLLALQLRLEDALARGGDLLAEEADFGRLFLWVPVAVALGIGLYFALPREPMLTALALVFVAAIVATSRARRRPVLFAVGVALTAVLAGAALAKLRTELVTAPILDRERTVSFAGTVEQVEGGSERLRLLVRLTAIDEKVPAGHRPERILLSVRRGAAHLAPGKAIKGLARLRPPQGPVMPGGYDFARAYFFRGIGATGFAYGTPKPAAAATPAPNGFAVLRGEVETLRHAIAMRIRESLPGDAGEVATALIIGDRRGIDAGTTEALRRSGLAHILAISGLHMALVTGAVFAMVRAMLALVPDLALARPIRKWAAAVALATGAAYLVLSGAGIATQRAFIMAVVVLLAVLVGRPALTMRSVALAALAVMAFAPEAVVGPSFQMSFAAVIALVAGYESLVSRKSQGATAGHGVGSALAGRLWRYVIGLALTSLIAGLATSPIAAFHFHRVAPLGLVANLLAMPIVATIIMPAGVLAMVAAPFGLDPLVLPIMGAGIDAVVAIASTIADWTPHGGVIGRLPLAAALLFALALVWGALWRTRLRRLAFAPLVAGAALIPLAAEPDILIAADGKAIAIRNANGRLTIAAGKGTDFTVENWLRADGDTRPPGDPALLDAAKCDPLGCTLPIPPPLLGAAGSDPANMGAASIPGTGIDDTSHTEPAPQWPPPAIALVRHPLAFPEDCRLAKIVVSSLPAPPWCRTKTLVLDRAFLARSGAIAIYRGGHTILPDGRELAVRLETALPRFSRPWHPKRPEAATVLSQ